MSGFIVGTLIALFTLTVGWLTYLRTNPKKVLSYSYVVQQLVNTAVLPRVKLSISLNGRSMANPHLLVFELQATGRADIDDDDFKGGKDLIFELGTKAVSLEDTADAEAFEIRGTKLHFAPNVLKRKYKPFRIGLLCDETPFLQLSGRDPLSGVVVKDVSMSTMELPRYYRKRLWQGMVAGTVVAMFISLLVLFLLAMRGEISF